MIKETLYQYLGENGTILSPVLIEGVQKVKKIRLTAEDNKSLTKDNKNFTSQVIVPVSEIDEWQEV